jgi:hypothetical protein
MTVVRFSDVYSCLESKGIIRDYSVAPTSQVPTVVHGFVLLNGARNDPRFRSLDWSFVSVPLEKEKTPLLSESPDMTRSTIGTCVPTYCLMYRHYAENLLSRRSCNGILRYLTLHAVYFIEISPHTVCGKLARRSKRVMPGGPTLPNPFAM